MYITTIATTMTTKSKVIAWLAWILWYFTQHCSDLYLHHSRLFGRGKQEAEGHLLETSEDVEDLDIVVDFREYHKGKSQNQSQQMTNLWPNINHRHFPHPPWNTLFISSMVCVCGCCSHSVGLNIKQKELEAAASNKIIGGFYMKFYWLLHHR